MNRQKIIETIEEIRNLFETSNTYDVDAKDNALLYGCIEGPYPDKYLLVINGRKKVIEFDNKINKLWENDSVLYNNFTKKDFEQRLVRFIRLKIDDSSKFNIEDFENIRKINEPIIEREIFKEIKGVKISSNAPITIKGFSFYSWPNHKNFIQTKYPEAFIKNGYYFSPVPKSLVLVSTTILSANFERACELADIRFKKLENFLKYLLTEESFGNELCNEQDIGIFNYRENSLLSSIEVTKDSINSIGKVVGTYNELELTKDLLFKKEHSEKIWNLFESSNPNNLEKRLINAIEWVGKAKNEIDSEKALIQFLFAIEALVNFNEQKIVSPSVSYGMCETISILLGEDKTERLEIDKIFNQLYSIRSSIVHGNAKGFSKYDLENAKSLSEKLIAKFFNDNEIIKLGVNGIKRLIKEKKYENARR